MTVKPLLIVADPDGATRTTIATALSPYFQIQEAGNLQATYHLLKTAGHALLIVGLEQPDGDGLAFVSTLREQWSKTSLCIACLSTRNAIGDKVTALRSGADDYVVKPLHLSPIYGYRMRLLWRLHLVEGAKASSRALSRVSREI